MNTQVGSLKLTGKDSIDFFNSLYRPTDEEIHRHNELIKKIDNEIKITDAQDGFKAEFFY